MKFLGWCTESAANDEYRVPARHSYHHCILFYMLFTLAVFQYSISLLLFWVGRLDENVHVSRGDYTSIK